jgi:hypothetical protein
MVHGAAESVGSAPTNYYTEIRVSERGKGGEGKGNMPVGQDFTQAGERRTNPSSRRNADGCIKRRVLSAFTPGPTFRTVQRL